MGAGELKCCHGQIHSAAKITGATSQGVSGAFEFLVCFPMASEPQAGVTSCPSGKSPKVFYRRQQQLASSLVVSLRRVSRSLRRSDREGAGVSIPKGPQCQSQGLEPFTYFSSRYSLRTTLNIIHFGE